MERENSGSFGNAKKQRTTKINKINIQKLNFQSLLSKTTRRKATRYH